MSGDIFISHSSKDMQVARTICSALEHRGFDCWMASRDVPLGANFQDAIVQAITAAKMMILVFSTNASNSNEIKKELVIAGQHNLVVIPVRVEDVLPSGAFAYELATRQWIDMFEDWEQAIEKLVARITAVLAAQTAAPDDAGKPASAMAVETKRAIDKIRGSRERRLAVAIGICALAAVTLGGLAIYGKLPFSSASGPAAPRGARETGGDPTAAIGPYSHIILQGTRGQTQLAELNRIGANAWVWIENRDRFNFRSVSETRTEMILFDASRNMWHRLDFEQRKNFWRIGTEDSWKWHYDIVSFE